MDITARLEKVTSDLAETDVRRTQLMNQRDALIRQARDAGVTWVELQRITHLTPRAISLALERAKPQH